MQTAAIPKDIHTLVTFDRRHNVALGVPPPETNITPLGTLGLRPEHAMFRPVSDNRHNQQSVEEEV